jgi:outer membrane protein assembly factor BamB
MPAFSARGCLSLATLVCLVSSAHAQEWTRFRGPNGTGISLAKSVPTQWTESDYNWRVELPGIGHSSPVVWGDKVFVTSANEDTAERIVLCLSAADGHVLWKHNYSSAIHPKHLRNSFASSTPAVDQDHVYVSWTAPEEYTLMALNHDGREAWRTSLGPFVSQHSGGTSPIVFRDMVVLGNDQDGPSFLTAVGCRDGKTVWRVDRTSAVVAYSTPCVRDEGKPSAELIFNSQAHGISGIDPYTGHTNWELTVFNKRSVSSPVIADGLVFGTCGSGGGGNYVAAVRPGDHPKLEYKLTDGAPYVPTLLATRGLLFMWSDKGIVSCVKVGTGKPVWQKRVGGNYSGSPVCAGDHLYCIAEDGTVVVLSATEKYDLVSRNPLGEDSRSTPAISGGRMYLRTYSHLVSIGGK